MTIVIIQNTDGSCSILHPAPDMFIKDSRTRQLLPELNNKTDEEILNWIIEKDVPAGLEYRVTTRDKIPEDRYFRNAWTDDNPTDTVDVNLDTAKEIQKDKLRQLRAPILQKLDIDFMRAMEQNLNAADIVTKKQELRDITKLTMPDNLDDLKNFIPEILKEDK